MNTHNICFRGEIRKIFLWIFLISGVKVFVIIKATMGSKIPYLS